MVTVLPCFPFFQHLWKRRFFVLNKSNKQQDYQLKYFNSDNPKDRALGEIDLRE